MTSIHHLIVHISDADQTTTILARRGAVIPGGGVHGA